MFHKKRKTGVPQNNEESTPAGSGNVSEDKGSGKTRKKHRGKILAVLAAAAVIVSGLILILMLSTFLSAATFNDGRISVELTSRNFVYAPSDTNHQTISVRGPYTIDSAIESETDILRIPQDALSTMEMTENDTMIINHTSIRQGMERQTPLECRQKPERHWMYMWEKSFQIATLLKYSKTQLSSTTSNSTI